MNSALADLPEIAFDYSGSGVTRVSLLDPITFTIDDSHSFSGFELRIADVFLNDSSNSHASTNGLIIAVDEAAAPAVQSALQDVHTGLGLPDHAELVFAFNYFTAYSLTSGQTVTVSGIGIVDGGFIPPPTAGNYTVFLVARSTEQVLAQGVSIVISASAIPEPATSATVFAVSALGIAFLVRRQRNSSAIRK